MTNPAIVRLSSEFFIAAALLGLFGAAALHTAGEHGAVQLLLAVLMAGAGAFLRSGTGEARLFGLAVAGITVLVGGYVLVVQGGYVVGTIVAVFALIHLASTPATVPPAAWAAPAAPISPGTPLAAFDAPTYGAPVPPTYTAPSPPQYGLPVVPSQPQSADQPSYFAAPAHPDESA
jgi:hypothetical protein